MVMGVEISNTVSEEFSFEKEKAVAKKYAQRFQWEMILIGVGQACVCLLYTSPSPRDKRQSRMPSSA